MTRRVRFTPFVRAGVFLASTLLAAAAVRAADVPFVTPPPISTSAIGAYSAALADVDGDGDLDALSASIYDDKVAWYENVAGNGSVWVARTITTSANFAFSVHGADVDGDGDTDVLSASVQDDKIAWYENVLANGTAWTTRTIALTADGPRSVRTADVDGDGDTDVLSASVYDDKIAWYDNLLGNGTAWAPRTISTSADSAWSVAAADVDRDGDQDVLSSSPYDNKVAWYENVAGNGLTWTLRTISTAAEGAFGLFAADVDRDGDVDALSASLGDGELTWHENTAGNGSAWTEHPIATNLVGPYWIAAGDIDADGDMDAVATILFDVDAVIWFENAAGNGTSWLPRTITTAVNAPMSALAGDVDGDGDLDVVSAVLYHNAVAWYRNDTIHETGCFASTSPIASRLDGAYSLQPVDVDRDGDVDVVSGSGATSDLVAWSENAGQPSNWPLHTVSTAFDDPRSVAAADVDGDGDPDVLSASTLDWVVGWHENAGAGLWTFRTITTQALGPSSVVPADIDGDGDPDAVTASFVDDNVAWHRNPGGLTTPWTSVTIATLIGTFEAHVADIDRDGDMDVISGRGIAIHWHDNVAGDGSTWVTRTVATDYPFLSGVFPADIDGDGDIDVVSVGNLLAWHENIANGTAWAIHTVVAASQYSVVAADGDRDGDMDLLVGSVFSAVPGPVVWYENAAGNGSEWTPHVVSTVPSDGRDVGMADVEGDGSLDVLSAAVFDGAISLHPSRPGQVAFAATDVAPPAAMNSDVVAMLRIGIAHGGRPGDGTLELARLGLRFEEEPGDPLTTAEANAIIESLRIYRDADGNGVFDPGVDVLVTSVPSLVLTAGVQLITFTDGDPNVQVAHGSPRTYFVVTELTANASTQVPNEFRVTHLGTGPSASLAEDRTYDIPLRPACPADNSSGFIGITPVELMDFRIE